MGLILLRAVESWRVENTPEMESSLWPSPAMLTTKPCPQVPLVPFFEHFQGWQLWNPKLCTCLGCGSLIMASVLSLTATPMKEMLNISFALGTAGQSCWMSLCQKGRTYRMVAGTQVLSSLLAGDKSPGLLITNDCWVTQARTFPPQSEALPCVQVPGRALALLCCCPFSVHVPFPSLLCCWSELIAQKLHFLARTWFPVLHTRRQISQQRAGKALIALAWNGPAFVLLFLMCDFCLHLHSLGLFALKSLFSVWQC